MEKVTNGIIQGSEINTLEMHKTIKIIMMDLLKGYPTRLYLGIFKGRFKKEVGDKVRDILEKDGLIEVGNIKINNSKETRKYYRLTSRGIDFAISLSQLYQRK